MFKTFMKSNAIKASLIGMALTSLVFGEAAYSPHKYQQNDWFGEFGENNAMYVNPASIVEADQMEVSLGIYQTISGKAGQEFLAVTVPYDYSHSFSFAAFENGAQIEGGESYVENAFMFGYAYRLIHSVALGADLTVLQIDQFSQNQQIGLGVDVGVSWNPFMTSKLGFLQLGLAFQNLLQPRISTASSSDGYSLILPGEAESYGIPQNLNLSAFYRGLNRFIEAKAELSFVDVIHDENEGGTTTVSDRIETSFTLTYYLSYNIGVKLRLTKEGYPVLGATVNVKDVNFLRYFEIDLEMSHDDIIERKNRGFIWSSKFTARFGPTREESIGARRYKRLKIEPENDYRAAMRLYLQRRFLEASYAFGKVMTKYPSFHLVDQAAYYKGKSFENMRMHKAARLVYKNAINDYPHSEQQAKYLYQEMNIDYKEGKFANALKKYDEIVAKYGDTDVKADADYIAGQIMFNQNEYDKALTLLEPILPGNANYVYARFTMGIIYSKKEEMERSEAAFQDIVNYAPSNQSEKDMQESAKVKLGHIFFSAETPRYAEAAELYKQIIQSDSHVRDEALMALAWSLVKARKPGKALSLAEQIISRYPQSFLVPEAHLISGYAYFLQEDWKNAEKSLKKCKELVDKPLISMDERSQQEQEYSSMVKDFETVQVTAVDLAKQLPTQRVMKKRAELKPNFDKANKQIDDHFQFLQKAVESDNFESSRKRIKEDAEFTLGEVLSRMGQGGGESLDDDDLDLNDL